MQDLNLLLAYNMIVTVAAVIILVKYLFMRRERVENERIIGSLWCLDRDPNEITIGELSRCTHKITVKKKSQVNG